MPACWRIVARNPLGVPAKRKSTCLHVDKIHPRQLKLCLLGTGAIRTHTSEVDLCIRVKQALAELTALRAQRSQLCKLFAKPMCFIVKQLIGLRSQL